MELNMDAIDNFLNAIIKLVRPLFSRKGLKKYLNGILEPDVEELKLIGNYIEVVRPKMIANGSSIILRQIEQMKIPYLRDITVYELDFLIDSNIDLHGIFDVIIAKGGFNRDLAAIVWNESKKHYEERKVPFMEKIIIPLGIASIPVLAYFLYYLEYSKISNMYIFFILYLLYYVFILIPLSSGSFNINDAKKRLLAGNNRVIFGNN